MPRGSGSTAPRMMAAAGRVPGRHNTHQRSTPCSPAHPTTPSSRRDTVYTPSREVTLAPPQFCAPLAESSAAAAPPSAAHVAAAAPQRQGRKVGALGRCKKQ